MRWDWEDKRQTKEKYMTLKFFCSLSSGMCALDGGLRARSVDLDAYSATIAGSFHCNNL